jgi:hypothetical protein
VAIDNLTKGVYMTLKDYKKRLDSANDVLKIQGLNGNWDMDNYMQGMFNGMELIMSIMEDRKPNFRKLNESEEEC